MIPNIERPVSASPSDGPAIGLPRRSDFADRRWIQVLVGFGCAFLWLPLVPMLVWLMGARGDGLIEGFGMKFDVAELMISFFGPLVLLAIVVRLLHLYPLSRGFVLGILVQMAAGTVMGLVRASSAGGS